MADPTAAPRPADAETPAAPAENPAPTPGAPANPAAPVSTENPAPVKKNDFVDDFTENAANFGKSAAGAAAAGEAAIATQLGKLPLFARFWFGGAIVALLGCFFPWWGISSAYPQGAQATVNAFSGPTYLPGILLFFGSLFFILVGLYGILNKPLPGVIARHEGWLRGHAAGMMVLLALVVFSIYTTPEYSFSNAQTTQSLRFGIFVEGIGVVVLAIGLWLESFGVPDFGQKSTPAKVAVAPADEKSA